MKKIIYGVLLAIALAILLFFTITLWATVAALSATVIGWPAMIALSVAAVAMTVALILAGVAIAMLATDGDEMMIGTLLMTAGILLTVALVAVIAAVLLSAGGLTPIGIWAAVARGIVGSIFLFVANGLMGDAQEEESSEGGEEAQESQEAQALSQIPPPQSIPAAGTVAMAGVGIASVAAIPPNGAGAPATPIQTDTPTVQYVQRGTMQLGDSTFYEVPDGSGGKTIRQVTVANRQAMITNYGVVATHPETPEYRSQIMESKNGRSSAEKTGVMIAAQRDAVQYDLATGQTSGSYAAGGMNRWDIQYYNPNSVAPQENSFSPDQMNQTF